MQGGLALPFFPRQLYTTWKVIFPNVPMSHNQHQTHQPPKVWPTKTMVFVCCNAVESVPKFREVTSYPSRFQNTPPPEPKKKAKRGRNAFQDTQCFSIPENQTSWKKGWSTLVGAIFFWFYDAPNKTPQKNMPTKMVRPYSFLGFLVNILDLQDDEDQPKKNDGMFPHLGTEGSQRWKNSWK